MKYYFEKIIGANMQYRKIKNLYHFFQAVLANLYYGFPSRKLFVIGVTGTDGKTTTTHMIYHILKRAGIKTSMISSIYADIGGKIYETGLHTTTPSSFDIQSFLSLAAEKGHTHFIIETTAHGIDQSRIWGIDFFVSVLTNVTHEHLESIAGYDYFKNIDSYLKTKAQLLLLSKTAIVNRDDDSFSRIVKILKENNHDFKTYGKMGNVDCNLNTVAAIPTIGLMNRYNMTAAYCVCRNLGIKHNDIIKALKQFKLPKGRLDLVFDKDFKCIVDFAHTVNSIRQALVTIREDFLDQSSGRLIHVFGAAGLRDRTKRLLMGEASGEYSDAVILTEEDYRTEDPEEICAEIAKGLKRRGFKYVLPANFHGKNREFTTIIDRKLAIQKAIKLARKSDVVVLTGKSHEKSLARGHKEYPWDEYEVINSALELKLS